jgi:hypothetical protein
LTGSARALQLTLGDSSASFRVIPRLSASFCGKKTALPCPAARKEKPSKLIASKVHLCSKVSQALAVSSARFSGEPPVSLNLPSLSQGDSRVLGSQAKTLIALVRSYMQPLYQRQKSAAFFCRSSRQHHANRV